MAAVLAEVALQDDTPHNIPKLSRSSSRKRAIFKAAAAIREALWLSTEGI